MKRGFAPDQKGNSTIPSESWVYVTMSFFFAIFEIILIPDSA